MKENIKEVLELSKNVDRVFYLVNAEGKQLKQAKAREVTIDLAVDLGLLLYATRLGPSVENPKTLLEELELLGIEKFEIVSIMIEKEKFVMLSHDDKEKFVEQLKNSELNSGAIAQNIASKLG